MSSAQPENGRSAGRWCGRAGREAPAASAHGAVSAAASVSTTIDRRMHHPPRAGASCAVSTPTATGPCPSRRAGRDEPPGRLRSVVVTPASVATGSTALAALDRGSFAEVASPEHRRAVYSLLCQLSRDPAAAEDLTQDTFVRALRAWPRYDP